MTLDALCRAVAADPAEHASPASSPVGDEEAAPNDGPPTCDANLLVAVLPLLGHTHTRHHPAALAVVMAALDVADATRYFRDRQSGGCRSDYPTDRMAAAVRRLTAAIADLESATRP